jgi:phospholipase C
MGDGKGFGGRIDHIVVLMMENRSFDNMLGWLYDPENHDPRFREPPRGQAFEGLAGTPKSNPLPDGGMAFAHRGEDMTMPHPDPNEAYNYVYAQQFGVDPPPSDKEIIPNRTDPPLMQGFARDYANAIDAYNAKHSRPLPTRPEDIMQCYPPRAVPVTAGLARAYAVCDHWFSSVPTETYPNRSFVHAGTSSGYVYNFWGSLAHLDAGVLINDTDTLYNRLEAARVSWRVYHGGPRFLCATLISQKKLWEYTFSGHFSTLSEFYAHAATGQLPAYTFLEPNFINSVEHGPENDMHPAYLPTLLDVGMGISNVLNGEILLYQVYQALRHGPAWDRTLLVITFDEHGGCYDHVPPPPTVSPDGVVVPLGRPGGSGFDFQRLGVRVPSILVSPWIEEGTVFSTLLDHTSVIRSVFECFDVRGPGGAPATLLARDQQSSSLAGVLTRTEPRTDMPVLHPRPAPPFDRRMVDEELGHFQQALVRAAHAHAGYQSARHPSLRGLGDLLRAPTIRTRQEAVTHFRQVEEHVRKAL